MKRIAKVCSFAGEGLIILAYLCIAVMGLIGNMSTIVLSVVIFAAMMILALILLGIAGTLGLIEVRHESGHRP